MTHLTIRPIEQLDLVVHASSMGPVKQDVVDTERDEILVRSWCISPIREAALPGVEDLVLLRAAVRDDKETAVVLHVALYALACSPYG